MATDAELLALLETALTARMSGRVISEYRIGSLDIKYAPITELIALRNNLRNNVARADGTTVLVDPVNPIGGGNTPYGRHW